MKLLDKPFKHDVDSLQKTRAYQKSYRESHKAESRAYKRAYYYRNHEQECRKRAAYKRSLTGARREHINALARIGYRRNPDKASLRNADYRATHKEYFRDYQRQYRQNSGYFERRYKDDPQYRLAVLLRRRLRNALHGNLKKGSAVQLLGCSISELRFYIEGKFRDGMTWKNWKSDGWHLDHIIPLSFFDLQDKTQLAKACHYTNLQPLWATENIRKSNKILI